MRNLLVLSMTAFAKASPAEHPKSSASSDADAPSEAPRDPEAGADVPSGPVELLKKLVAKDIVKRSKLVYTKDDKDKVMDDEPRALYRVFGQVRDTKTGISNFGEWTAFIGSFEAIRHSDHQRFQSATLHLQNPAEGLLLDHFYKLRKDALDKARQTNPDAKLSDNPVTVIFAFDIGVRPSQKWVTENVGNSYEYTVRTVFESDTTDPLTSLRAAATKSLPRLPAPSPAK